MKLTPKTGPLTMTLAALGLAAALPQAARAQVVFDNSGAINASSYQSTETRGAGYAIGTWISSVTANTTITNIGVRDQMNAAGDLKFVIFDDGTGSLLFSSAPQAYAAETAQTWKTSDTFSFTLLAGHQYDIGAVSDVASTSTWGISSTPYAQNGLTTPSHNVNFNGFATPTADTTKYGVIEPLRLYANATPAPEPSSVAAFAFTGLGALGLMLKARRRKAAVNA